MDFEQTLNRESINLRQVILKLYGGKVLFSYFKCNEVTIKRIGSNIF